MKKILILGNGLLGSAITKSLKNNFELINIDPKNLNKNIDNVQYLKGTLTGELILEYGPFIAGAINCSYPVHNDLKGNNTAHNIAKNVAITIEDAILFLRIFDEVNTCIKNPKFLVQFSSIYSHFIPRAELYSDTDRSTPDDYVASKAAINQLIRVYAKKNQNKGVYVNAIAPGGVFNNQENQFIQRYGKHTVTGNMLSPNNLFGLVKLLTNPISNPITGQILTVDDGFTL